MTINNNEGEKKGQFVAESDGQKAGLMEYTWAGEDKFIIDHTEVSEGFEGQGVGKKLVLEAVDYARKKDVKILPLCPFAKAVFDKTTAFQDVLF